MKKLLFSLTALAAVLVLAAPLSAQTVTSCSFGYRWDNELTCDADNGGANPYNTADSGQTTEMFWCLQHSGAIEGNQPGGGANRHPYANNFGVDGTDGGGAFANRNATTCTATVTASFAHDNAAFEWTVGAAATHQYGVMSAWVVKGDGSDAKTQGAYTFAEAAASMGATDRLFVMYLTRAPTAAGDSTGANTNTGSTAWAVTAPNLAGNGSFKVTGAHPTGGFPYVNLKLSQSVMPPPFGGAANNGASVRWGVRVKRSELAPGSATYSSYAAVRPLGSGHGASVRFDGTGAVAGEWGDLGGGNFYLNDFAGSDRTTNANAHYSFTPTFSEPSDTSWTLQGGLSRDAGIPVLFGGGSWIDFGSRGGSIGGIPTPVSIESFSATFDPRTGRVTLNWKTGSDTGGTFAILREVWANGKPLGGATEIGSLPSTGRPGDRYSFVDTSLDLSRFSKLTKGAPIDVKYRIEVVNNDGSRSGGAETSIRISTKAGKR